MIPLVHIFLAPLMCGYFLNGGIGTFMQPSAASQGSGPPPSGTYIVTQGGGGAKITTSGGTPLVTG
jgi:hypothetical protein